MAGFVAIAAVMDQERMTSKKREYLSTNRAMLGVRFSETFLEWLKNSGFDQFVGKAGSAEMGPGCYLVDVPPLDMTRATTLGCSFPEEEDEILDQAFPEIVVSEFLDLGLPESDWPEVETLEQFRMYFSIQRWPLIADLGQRPFEVRRTPV